MIDDYKDALQFAEDYFQLNYLSFLQKYFKGSRQNEIKRNLTPSKFKQLFGELSPTQLKLSMIIYQNILLSLPAREVENKGFGTQACFTSFDGRCQTWTIVDGYFSRAAATEFKKDSIILLEMQLILLKSKLFILIVLT